MLTDTAVCVVGSGKLWISVGILTHCLLRTFVSIASISSYNLNDLDSSLCGKSLSRPGSSRM